MTEKSKTPKSSSFGFLWIVGAIAVWYYILTPSSSHFVMTSEATVSGYALAAELYPTLTPTGQAKIARMYEKGYLTRNDVSRVISITLDDRNDGEGVGVQPTSLNGDSRERMFDEGWMWMAITGELSSSNSKTKFETELTATGVTWEKPVSRDRSLCEIFLPWCATPDRY